MCRVIYLLQKTPKELEKKSIDWQQVALTLDLWYFCMGDPLTTVNKRHWVRVMTYDNKLKEVRKMT